jgi:hypothetical protein
MPNNFVRIVNSYADSIEARHTNWKELIHAYPGLKDGTEPTEGEIGIKTSVHCECTVAVHMLQMICPVDQRAVEIGISKHSCWLCQKYLEFLSAWNFKFIIGGYQGKIHAGWKPPPDGPDDAHRSMIGLLKEEMDEILANAKPRRRSDSFPTNWRSELSAIRAEKAVRQVNDAVEELVEKLFPC